MDADGKTDESSRKAWFTRAEFQHSLLLAMPLPADVSGGLEKIQALVQLAMTEDASLPDTVQALRELGELVGRCAVSDGIRLATEVSEQVMLRLTSPQLTMIRVSLLLRHAGMRIGSEGPPSIEMLTGKSLPPPEDVPREVLEALASAAFALGQMSTQDLSAHGESECRAAIQVVWLHSRYGFHFERGISRHQRRLEYFRGAGLEVWKSALSSISARQKQASYFRLSYGRPAYRQIRRLLQAAAQGEDATASVSEVTAESVGVEFHRVLLEPIPLGADRDEKTQLEKYNALARPLPLAKVPSLDHLMAAQARLIVECPWAAEVIISVFRELIARSVYGSKRLGLSPVLFVGPPGVGKSRLARRLAEEIGVLFLPLPFASMGDSHLLCGTSRGWATAQASPVLSFILARQTPSVIVLADEIDKSQTRYANSASPHSSLLALLEGETARSWVDLLTPTEN